MESGEVKKYYKWNSGSRAGKVETYLAEDEKNIYFESGRFTSKEVFDHQLREITEDEFNSSPKNETPSSIQSVPQANSIEEMEALLKGQYLTETPPPQPVVEANPIKIILDKQRKKEKIILPVEFEIEIPTKKVLELLDVMFDRDEVIAELIKSATATINESEIVDKLTKRVQSHLDEIFDEEKDD